MKNKFSKFLTLFFGLAIGMNVWGATITLPTTTLDLHNVGNEFNTVWYTGNSFAKNYYYSEPAKILVLSAYAAYQSKSSHTWINTDSGNSSNSNTAWSETGVFKGGSYYMSSSAPKFYCATIRNTERNHCYRVKHCVGASALVGGKAGISAYEINNSVAAANATANQTVDEAGVVSISGLDGSKEYVIVVYGNNGSNNVNFYEIAFNIEETIDPESPEITANVNDEPYATTVNVAAKMSITASHVTSYQWYTCASDGTNGQAIDGATESSYSFSTATVGTYYFYCVVTNTNATGDKTATSSVATVNVTAASTDATLSSLKYYGNTSVPDFDPETLNYNVTLAYGTTTYPNVTPTKTDANASVDLNLTDNVQSIVVTAQDGVTTKTYTITYNYETAPATPAGFDKFWNFSNWDNIKTDYAYQTIVDGLKMEGGTYGIDACMNGAKAEGINFTKRLNLQGGGTDRHFEFDVTGACVITVYGYNGNAGRSIAIKVGSADEVLVCATTNENKNTVLKGTYVYTGSGETIKMYSKSSGFYVLGVGVTYLSSDFNVALGATDDDDNYATFSCARNVQFAEGVAVYTISYEENAIHLNEVANKQVPAEKGVLLKSNGTTATYNVIASATELPSENKLRAASVAMENEGYEFFKLAYGDWDNKTDLGFYWGAENGAAFTAKVGGAYLAIPTSSLPALAGSRNFTIGGQPVATGMEQTNSVSPLKSECRKALVDGKLVVVRNGAMFNLNGMLVK